MFYCNIISAICMKMFDMIKQIVEQCWLIIIIIIIIITALEFSPGGSNPYSKCKDKGVP